MLRAKTWCVIGDVLNTSKAASRVVTHLERHGKTVYCVNPSPKTVRRGPGQGGRRLRGAAANASGVQAETDTLKRCISAVPAQIDVIDLIVNPVRGAEQLKEAAKLGIPNVLVQPGANSEEVLAITKEAGMTVQHGCVMNLMTEEHSS